MLSGALSAALLTVGCSDNAAVVGELCSAQDHSYEYCSCYVGLIDDALNEEHMTILADMARFQINDNMSEAEAREALIEKYGRVTVVRFLSEFISPQVEAELSCPS